MDAFNESLDRIGLHCVKILKHSACRARSRHKFDDIVVFFVLVELPDKVFYLVFVETDDTFPDCGWCD